MKIIELDTSDSARHECISWEEMETGLIFFRCPQCDYLRRLDPSDGSTRVIRPGDEDALHFGANGPYAPVEQLQDN